MTKRGAQLMIKRGTQLMVKKGIKLMIKRGYTTITKLIYVFFTAPFELAGLLFSLLGTVATAPVSFNS